MHKIAGRSTHASSAQKSEGKASEVLTDLEHAAVAQRRLVLTAGGDAREAPHVVRLLSIHHYRAGAFNYKGRVARW